MSRRVRAAGLLGAAVAATVLLTGCGSAGQPDPYPPTGVDGLVIPTPDVDPADFVDGVDNPWFPLEPGETWTYELADADGVSAVEVRVGQRALLAGVPVTWVVTALDSGRTWRDAYAQDSGGNVWWLARSGDGQSWRAGQGGFEAGLVMPAEPRVGDGYVHRGRPDGVSGEWSRVQGVDAERTVDGVPHGDLLWIEGTALSASMDDAGTTEAQRWFAPGLGLVLEERADSATLSLVP